MRRATLAASICAAFLVGAVFAAAASAQDVRVSSGSPAFPFSQNKQNEPALAVDAHAPTVLASGANDNIDMEACNAGDDTTCPFTPDVGASGIYFSFNSGATWTQPTYTGLTARDCQGVPGPDPGCTAHRGPIGTLPRYDEVGLVSDGDPALAFGPRPGAGGFSWANGSRLYYANLTSSVSASAGEPGLKGFEGIAVSRTDDVAAAAAGDNSAWMLPVIASKQSSTTFSDKEQIWADNASSSPFFGNVYICYAQFRSNAAHQNGNAPAPLLVLVSRDGGSTWSSKQLTPAGTDPHSNSPNGFGISGCSIRTDSHGVVYVFGERFAAPFSLPTHSDHVMFKSTDGGKKWTHAIKVQDVVDPCFVIDPVIGRCVEDGIAGARNDLAASPSVDIANGAPTGADATNELVDVWADGRDGLNREHVMLSYSTSGGGSWSAPTAIEQPGDRGYYAAPGISPNGTDLYVTYNAFGTPFRETTADPRTLFGVVRHSDLGFGGTPGGFVTLHRGASGDPRASSQNDLQAEFLGDYVYAVATRTFGSAVWNDVRNGADCPAIDTWRQSLRDGGSVPRPAPQQECAPNFGNTDIYGGTFADPTP